MPDVPGLRGVAWKFAGRRDQAQIAREYAPGPGDGNRRVSSPDLVADWDRCRSGADLFWLAQEQRVALLQLR